MRWSDSPARFVRPLKNILAVFNGRAIQGSIYSEGSVEFNLNGVTTGHRFLAPDAFEVSTFADYRTKLEAAKVLIDPADRRAKIEADLKALAAAEGLTVRDDLGLLDEVTGLVEWPVVLTGTIDDAFMDSFLCVRPSGKHAAFGRLTRFEAEFAKWLRGDLRIADDNAVTAQQIRDHHLVLFGDPQTNVLIKRIAGKLPIRWDKGAIHVGAKTFDARAHLLVMIYPNPLNPDRYVVLNTGHTFGEKEFRGTNALLYPRLGDWAVLDGKGEPVAAGLFDDNWRLKVPSSNSTQ